MSKTPILGASYVARSINAADARMVNLFAEAIPEGGKEAGFLSRCPGLSLLATCGNGPIRGMRSVGIYAYVVSGGYLYRVDAAYTVTLIGAVAGTGPVSMSDNGFQIFIACNPRSFIYTIASATLTEITDADFPGAVTVSYIDGYFVFNEPNSQKLWVTALYDGTQIDALEFASAEGAPDNIVALITDHREVWVFGTNSTEVWYDAGLVDFPLSRIQGAFIEVGCAAPYSVAKLDNSVFWLSADARGIGMVHRANGYVPQRVSTHAIEYAIQGYATISDAVGYTYQQEGHAFYVLIFPTEGKTWVFDASTNLWHERAGFTNGLFTRHRSNCQMVFNSVVTVGDFENGNIYAFDLDVYADNGAIQKWLRSWRAIPQGQNTLVRSAQHSLQLDCEAGTGLNLGQGSDPQVDLRWSDDGGHTWSNYHSRSIGKIGATGNRCIWRRLGMTLKLRDRVYEISGTDPVKIAIVGAELHIDGTKS